MRLYLLPLLFIVSYLTACSNSYNQSAVKQELVKEADSIAKPKFKTLEFMVDDKPAFATIDTRYADFKDKKEFPLSLFITVNTIEKDSIGHPVKKETEIYNNIEADIIKTLDDQPLITAFIGRTTMNGYRDLIFYIKSSDQKKVNDLLIGLQKKHSRIKEFVFEEDPEWEAVADFYKALKHN
jgi:hypothetical protein